VVFKEDYEELILFTSLRGHAWNCARERGPILNLILSNCMKYFSIVVAALSIMNISTAQNAWIANDSTGSFHRAWGDLNDSGLVVKETSDGYYIDVKGEPQYLSKHYTLDQKHDFKIEVTLKMRNMAEDASGCGLFFGGGESYKQGYEFLMARNGNYVIGQVTYAGYTKIESGNSKGAIKTASWESNKLTMMRREGYWTFCINDVEMTTRQTYPFAGDRIGFFVDAKSAILVTSFKIYDWTLAASLLQYEKEPVRFVKLYDHFYDNKNNWSLTNDADVELSIHDGVYTMDNKTDGVYCAWNSADLGTFFDNYSLETQIKHQGGVNDWGYGLTFGLKDMDNRFVFFVSADGSAKIAKRQNGNWIDIMKWTQFDAIGRGDQTNHLEVRKINGVWTFYVNDQLIYSGPAQSFFGNKFGLYAEHRQKVSMNDIKVTQLYFPKN